MHLYQKILHGKEKIGVIGLGYVGLPLAVAFSKMVPVVGFDANGEKIRRYQQGFDVTRDLGNEAVQAASVQFTAEPDDLEQVLFFIVAVPTPVQNDKVPDLQYVKAASETVGRYLRPGAIVVYESTVYPGVTEDICVPILEEASGLKCGADFKVGYSPERINPGDRVHKLENIIKIVSGMDEETLETIAQIYELIIQAGVHRAPTIRVAEAAKVVENAQRDVNIAFMNELAMLFDDMGIDTKSVLEAAKTKWNFLPFTPGLVGGHCIGIDPYYLTYKAEDLGYHSKIILAARHINDEMGKYIVQQLVKLLVKLKEDTKTARVGFLGLTYKENCTDIRNSKVADMLVELKEYGIAALVTDPYADPEQALQEYGLTLCQLSEMTELNAVVLAVAHEPYAQMSVQDFDKFFREGKMKLLLDVKGIFDKNTFEDQGYYYWRL